MTKNPSATLKPEYFDDVYAAKDDPWEFTTSDYERAKYADTLAHLPLPQYENGFEVGCSIGVLTAQLAAHCTQLLSVDVSERALEQARTRCASLPNVQIEHLQIPEEKPAGQFDLIVISEVGYYWDRSDLDRAMTLLAAHHAPGGHLLLVHWTPPVHDYPLTGDAVHDAWIARSEWRTLSDQARERYRISVLRRV